MSGLSRPAAISLNTSTSRGERGEPDRVGCWSSGVSSRRRPTTIAAMRGEISVSPATAARTTPVTMSSTASSFSR